MEGAIYWVEIEKILPNPYQPRKDFDQESLKELAESIKEYGILEPLLVTRKEISTEKGVEVFYELIAGERRWQAAKMVGLAKVPVIIKEVSQRAKLEIALIENLQRKDLNPVERAKGFARLMEEFGLTQKEIADRIGKSRAFVANTLRLLKLPDKILEALAEGKISESQARILLEIDDPILREEIFQETVNRNLTVREMKTKAKKISEKKEELNEWEEKLSLLLGKEVKIEKKEGELKVEIKLFSEDELNELLNKLSPKPENEEKYEENIIPPYTKPLFSE
jgi:ParB family transcriptional regulator, chromosome partitioning protein